MSFPKIVDFWENLCYNVNCEFVYIHKSRKMFQGDVPCLQPKEGVSYA